MGDHMKLFTDKIKMKGESLVLNSFPEKISKLNQLINSPEWNYNDLSCVQEKINLSIPDPVMVDGINDDHFQPPNKKRKANSVHEPEGTRVYNFPNGPITTNLTILKLSGVIKPLIRELMDDSNLLKMWLSFMIPKIEDGNNFGVAVQEDTLSEIQTVESEASASYDQIHRYFIARGKIVSKVAKYPHIEDYRQAVNELDEKQYVSLRLILREIQNRYAVLNDIVKKNLDKIKQPRNTNSESLY